MGQPVLQQPIFRRRIDAAKVNHFLDFILHPDLLQDVAEKKSKTRLLWAYNQSSSNKNADSLF